MTRDPERYHRRSIRLKGYDYRTPGLYVATVCIQHRRPLLGEIVDGEMCPTPAAEMVRTVWNEIPWAYPGVEIDAFVVMPNHIHGIVYLLPDDIEFGTDSGQEPPHREPGQAQGPAPTRDAATGVGATPCGCPSSANLGHDPGSMPPADSNRGSGRGEQWQTRGQGQTRGSAPTGGASRVGAGPRACPSPGHTGPPNIERSPTEFGRTSGGGDAGGEGQPQGVAPTEEASETPRLSLSDVVKRFKSLTAHHYGVGVRTLGWEPYQGRFWQRNYYETIVRSERDLERFRRYIEENPIRWADDRHNPSNPEIH